MITTDREQQLSNILNGTSKTNYVNGTDEEFIQINLNSREIIIPDSFQTIAVTGDHMAERLYFETDRYFDDMDLADENISISIIFQRPSLTYGKDYVTDVHTIDDNKIVFAWELKEDATRETGDLIFAVRFYSLNDEGASTYSLNTKVAKITVENSLKYLASIDTATQSTDVADGLNARISMLEKNLWNIVNDEVVDGTATIVLNSDMEMRYGEMSNISLSFPEIILEDYESELVFTSGEVATQFTYPDNIKWSGTDVYDGVFTPLVNTRNTVIFWHDGVYMNAVVRGVDI